MNSSEKEKLKRRAAKLANRSYTVEYDTDKLSDGTTVITAYNPELPGCMADGATKEEAERNLAETRAFHIYLLLSRSVAVPEPRVLPTHTGDPGIGMTSEATSIFFSFPDHVATNAETRGSNLALVIPR